MTDFDPDWLAALRAGTDRAPRRPRVPLLAGPHVIGSVEPDFLCQIERHTLVNGRSLLQKEDRSGMEGVAWRVHGELSHSLEMVARSMRLLGLTGAWRDEQLTVSSTEGHRLGSVERAAVRPLGIPTLAVHLVGFVSRNGVDSHLWVQQRALNKSTDPGMWDTLMGGLVGDHERSNGDDPLSHALARETWEEAGLRLADMEQVTHGGRISLRRPMREARHAMADAGYMVEHIDWFRCNVPDGVVPVNQDGEVVQFALLERDEVLDRLHCDEFTAEAALVLVAALGT